MSPPARRTGQSRTANSGKMLFFESFFGHYLAQAVLYSLVTLAAVEGVMAVWRITGPLLQIKFRLLILALPVLCPPLYYLLYPSRNVFHFREHVALIDLNRWLELPLGGGIAIWHLFTAVLVITTGVFFVKEVLPFIKHYLAHRSSLPVIEEGQFPRLDAALASLSKTGVTPKPTVLLSSEDMPIAYSSGRKALVVSAPTIDLLDDDELEAVVAHEVAHLSGQVVGINRTLLALRFLLFYNPIALPVFRRIIHDGEKLCDDLAIRFSGKRLSLTSGLLKLFRYSAANCARADTGKGHPLPGIASLENVACRNLARERVERIVHPDERGGVSYQNFRMAVTGIMLAALLFVLV